MFFFVVLSPPPLPLSTPFSGVSGANKLPSFDTTRVTFCIKSNKLYANDIIKVKAVRTVAPTKETKIFLLVQ